MFPRSGNEMYNSGGCSCDTTKLNPFPNGKTRLTWKISEHYFVKRQMTSPCIVWSLEELGVNQMPEFLIWVRFGVWSLMWSRHWYDWIRLNFLWGLENVAAELSHNHLPVITVVLERITKGAETSLSLMQWQLWEQLFLPSEKPTQMGLISSTSALQCLNPESWL